MTLILFRACKNHPFVGMGKKEILIYAGNESDAVRYLQSHPLFWGENWQPSDFKEVVIPKGPSPSILMYAIEDVRGDD